MRNAAAASDDPLPMPAACGKCFSKVITAPALIPRDWRNASAARRTMLVSSVGTPLEKGPLTSMRKSGAETAFNWSDTSANTTRLSSV